MRFNINTINKVTLIRVLSWSPSLFHRTSHGSLYGFARSYQKVHMLTLIYLWSSHICIQLRLWIFIFVVLLGRIATFLLIGWPFFLWDRLLCLKDCRWPLKWLGWIICLRVRCLLLQEFSICRNRGYRWSGVWRNAEWLHRTLASRRWPALLFY